MSKKPSGTCEQTPAGKRGDRRNLLLEIPIYIDFATLVFESSIMDTIDHRLAAIALVSGHMKGEVLRHRVDLKEIVERCEGVGRAEGGCLSPLKALDKVIDIMYDVHWFPHTLARMGIRVDRNDMPFLISALQFGRLQAHLSFYYLDKIDEFEMHYRKSMEHHT